jgi:DNA-binding response OmpR family regulator
MKVLIVDDDLVLADVVSFTLRRAGFDVILAHDGLAALERFRADQPQLIVLDLELPGLSGTEVCRIIRSEANTPIIMLTVRDRDEDVVHGLGIGADDYITKPFSPSQLIARSQAILRRAGISAEPHRLTFGELSLDPQRHTLERGNQKPIHLTPLEYRLIEMLMINSRQVIPTTNLIDRVWGVNGGDKAMLKQLIYRVRQKIENEDGKTGVYIEAVPGIGYALMLREVG